MRKMHQQQTQEIELMIGSGMYTWIGAWAQYGSPVPQVNPRDPRYDTGAPTTQSRISSAAHGEAVGIFSAMVWDIVKEDTHVYDN
jgi:hypothetical protein